jgi:hypothetical protein
LGIPLPWSTIPGPMALAPSSHGFCPRCIPSGLDVSLQALEKVRSSSHAGLDRGRWDRRTELRVEPACCRH